MLTLQLVYNQSLVLCFTSFYNWKRIRLVFINHLQLACSQTAGVNVIVKHMFPKRL